MTVLFMHVPLGAWDTEKRRHCCLHPLSLSKKKEKQLYTSHFTVESRQKKIWNFFFFFCKYSALFPHRSEMITGYWTVEERQTWRLNKNKLPPLVPHLHLTLLPDPPPSAHHVPAQFLVPPIEKYSTSSTQNTFSRLITL